MSEVSKPVNEKSGKVVSKKTSTRIDMTPMVDLAFLLLTFFVMTTTLNKPKAMQLAMPEKPTDQKVPMVEGKDVLTLVLDKDDHVFWYAGTMDPTLMMTDFSKEGIRKILVAKKKANRKLVVLIKATDEAKYRNMVDILDEMEINSMPRYMMVDITNVDKELVKNYRYEK